MRREYRKLAREIQDALSFARVRRSTFAWALLEEAPALYHIDPTLMEQVEKLKGESLHKLREDLFDLFAKVGKRTSDEVLKVRIQDLFTRYVAERPKGGRRKKGA